MARLQSILMSHVRAGGQTGGADAAPSGSEIRIRLVRSEESVIRRLHQQNHGLFSRSDTNCRRSGASRLQSIVVAQEVAPE